MALSGYKNEQEPIISLRTIKKIKITINKPTPLSIVSIEDQNGLCRI